MKATDAEMSTMHTGWPALSYLAPRTTHYIWNSSLTAGPQTMLNITGVPDGYTCHPSFLTWTVSQTTYNESDSSSVVAATSIVASVPVTTVKYVQINYTLAAMTHSDTTYRT